MNPELLARHAPRLPDWIGLVVTSRPDGNVIAPLQGLNPFLFETSSEKNLDDIRDHVRHELAAPLRGRADADRFWKRAKARSSTSRAFLESRLVSTS